MPAPADRTLSPRTGYTHARWEVAADALFAVEDRAALYHLPGDRQSWSGRLSDGLAGYGRQAEGLAAGTAGVRPRSEDRGRPLVEAASIALALRLTRLLLSLRLTRLPRSGAPKSRRLARLRPRRGAVGLQLRTSSRHRRRLPRGGRACLRCLPQGGRTGPGAD